MRPGFPRRLRFAAIAMMLFALLLGPHEAVAAESETSTSSIRVSENPDVRRNRPDFSTTGRVGAPAPDTAPLPENCIDVALGQSIQAALDAAAPGDAICLAAGEHRITRALTPKSGQTIAGRPGAAVNGSVVLTGWTYASGVWTAQGVAPENAGSYGTCAPSSYTGCRPGNTVFLDGTPLRRVASLPVKAGEVYIDSGHRVHIAQDPAGLVAELAVAAHIVKGSSAVDDVAVQSLVIEKAANLASQGAVDSRGGSGWRIEANEVRFNHGAGICADDLAVVRGNYVHRQGQLGICGHGSDGLYERNEIAANNTASFAWGWEAGGTKFVRTTRLTIRDNLVYDNNGPGLWADIDNISTLFEGNIVEGNAGPGIFHEISYAAVIRNNVALSNATAAKSWLDGAGILVSCSPNVDVYGNVVAHNGDGIGVKQTNRGSGVHGPHVTENVHVYDNVITMTEGGSGLVQNVGDSSYFTTKNNRFSNNEYHVSNASGKYWNWSNQSLTWAGWRATGQDATGSLTTGS